MTKLKTIEERWDEFIKHVGLTECQPESLVLMRRIFYAGWTECLSMLNRELAPLPEEEGCKHLDSFQQQCVDFVKLIEANKA